MITFSQPRAATDRDTSQYRISRARQHIEDSRAQMLRVSSKNLRKTAEVHADEQLRVDFSLSGRD